MLEKIKTVNDIKKLEVSELKILAKDIRQLILDTVLDNGGHLASNLGIVDLVVALYYVFNIELDKVIYDVGHQCYAHKILTGRKDVFSTLRQKDGISGFPKRSESKYDIANTGHASTAISLACGVSQALKLKGDFDTEVISIVGDGSLSGGLAHEALNSVKSIGRKQIIIINDNSMSISKSVGATSMRLLNFHSSTAYGELKSSIKNLLNDFNYSLEEPEQKLKFAASLKNGIKYFVQRGMPFDNYGVHYAGPVDGHDIKSLVEIFTIIKSLKESCIVHVVTEKGFGFKEAETNPTKYHGYSPRKEKSKFQTFSEIAGNKMIELANEHNNIVAVTAAMIDGTGLTNFQKAHKSKLIDVGIAEAHAVTMASGMAIEGLKPYVFIYSTFLQRACDQIIHDVCLENLPIVFCIDRAGIVPRDGETHQGVYDLSFLLANPNLAVLAPVSKVELEKMLEYVYSYDGPIAIRYPKDYASIIEREEDIKIEYGKWRYLKYDKNNKTTIIVNGARMAKIALEAVKGLKVNILSATFLNPIDKEKLFNIKGDNIVVFEDVIKQASLFNVIAAFYQEKNIPVNIKSLAVQNTVIDNASTNEILVQECIDKETLLHTINSFN